jgi:hypothetical protein
MHHPAGEIEPPLHTAGEHSDGIVRPIGKTYFLQDPHTFRLRAALRDAVKAGEELEILKAAE